MENTITDRILSTQTIMDLARECIERDISAAQRVQEEIDDCAAEGIDGVTDADDVEGKIDQAMCDLIEMARIQAEVVDYMEDLERDIQEIRDTESWCDEMFVQMRTEHNPDDEGQARMFRRIREHSQDLDDLFFKASAAFDEAEKIAAHIADGIEDAADAEWQFDQLKKQAKIVWAVARELDELGGAMDDFSHETANLNMLIKGIPTDEV